MAGELNGKVAVVTGAASGIGLASSEAMLAAGARVVMVDRDEAALKRLSDKHGDAVIPLVVDLLDPKDCASLCAENSRQGGPARHPACQRRPLCRRRPRRRRQFGDRPDAEPQRQRRDEERARRAAAHDRARERGTSSSRVRWPLIFRRRGSRSTRRPNGRSTASSRRCGGRCSSTASASARSRQARSSPRFIAGLAAGEVERSAGVGSLLEPAEVANVIIFMLTRPRGMTIRDVVMMPTNFDL